MYPDPILPRAHPDLLSQVTYDPFHAMPGDLPPAPRLFATAPQLARARHRIAQGIKTDTHGLSLLLTATKIDQPLPDIKPPTGPADWGGGSVSPPLDAAFKNALAFHLTGDNRHRERAFQAMRLAAHACAKTSRWTGFEHNEAVNAARAYDLLIPSGIHPDDDNLFRPMLWTLVHAMDQCHHRHCNNHNAMQMTARISLGVALGSPQVIHDTLYGNSYDGKWRYGLIHLLRHDFLSDGMNWEGVPGYHMLVLMMVCECLTVLENVGVNLWHRAWPASARNDGFDEHTHYGPKGDKHLTSAFDALIYQAFPNGDYSLLHDQVLGNLRGSWAWWLIFNKAFDTYAHPRYAWALTHSNHNTPITTDGPVPAWFQSGPNAPTEFVRFETRHFPPAPAPFTADNPFSLTGKHVSGSSLFPAHGSAILRDPTNPNDPAALGAYLYWGPHCAGHRSPASLHLDIQALGRRATASPHLPAAGYDEPNYLTWFRTTIAHNTVTVDGKSMFPYDFETNSIWEYELWRDTNSNSTLHLFQPGADFTAVRASNDTVYKDVTLDRTVILTPHYVLDVYRVTADRPRTLDWAMHSQGIFPTLPGATPIELGTDRGYRHLTNAHILHTSGDSLSLPYTLYSNPALASLWLPGAPGAQIILAADPAVDSRTAIGDSHAPAPRTSLIVRTHVSSALFISAWSFGPRQAHITQASGTADSDIQVAIRTGNTAENWSIPIASQNIGMKSGL